MSRTTLDLTEQRFGRLIVDSQDSSGAPGRPRWKCLCDCGSYCVVRGDSLRTGQTRSCGCLRKKNGQSTHNKSGSKAYQVWTNMFQRCNNPNHAQYADYGGRGISVCVRWQTFKSFYEDMGDPPLDMCIERVDNDKGYTKGNCRWATRTEENRNKRSNRILDYNGESRPMSEWAEEIGIKYGTLKTRLRLGWSVEEALETAVRPWRRRSKMP